MRVRFYHLVTISSMALTFLVILNSNKPPFCFSKHKAIQKPLQKPQSTERPKIGVMIWTNPAYMSESIQLGISAWQCYCLKAGYHFFLETYPFMRDGLHGAPFLSKLLATKKYMPYVDYLLVVDADTLVANTTRRLEDIIATGEHLFFHERMHNREIVAGVWLAKNSPFSKAFIDEWIEYAFCNCANEGPRWTNHDNGALIHLIYQKYLHTQDTKCGSLYQESNSLQTYLHFVQCVHDLLHNPIVNMPGIRIEQAETSWFKFLELGWQETGDWGTPSGPNVEVLWNRWTGNEFIVHTKHASRLLDKRDAECLALSHIIRPDLLLPPAKAAETMREESARFGHAHLGECTFSCPPLVEGGPPPLVLPQPAPKCHVYNELSYKECRPM